MNLLQDKTRTGETVNTRALSPVTARSAPGHATRTLLSKHLGVRPKAPAVLRETKALTPPFIKMV